MFRVQTGSDDRVPPLQHAVIICAVSLHADFRAQTGYKLKTLPHSIFSSLAIRQSTFMVNPLRAGRSF